MYLREDEGKESYAQNVPPEEGGDKSTLLHTQIHEKLLEIVISTTNCIKSVFLKSVKEWQFRCR